VDALYYVFISGFGKHGFIRTHNSYDFETSTFCTGRKFVLILTRHITPTHTHTHTRTHTHTHTHIHIHTYTYTHTHTHIYI
jgi:hypothetical protein